MKKITDEVFDLVNEFDETVGRIKRSQAHKDKSLIHRSVGIILVNQKGEIFFQKRSLGKDTEPGKWTISASGHVSLGETYKEAAIRELEEELGLKLHLTKLEKFLCRVPWESEFCCLFTASFSGNIKVNKKEIEEGRFFSHSKLISSIKSKEVNLSHMGIEALKHFGWGSEILDIKKKEL